MNKGSILLAQFDNNITRA
uniref:Uncharacterized protein n=1 Tax=Arundo donax TaxID=35708 RepID=A0A0A9APD3_ARUDO